MDETVIPPTATPPAAPEAVPAEKLATEYHWPGRLGTFNSWARFADCTMPPEPPARERVRRS